MLWLGAQHSSTEKITIHLHNKRFTQPVKETEAGPIRETVKEAESEKGSPNITTHYSPFPAALCRGVTGTRCVAGRLLRTTAYIISAKPLVLHINAKGGGCSGEVDLYSSRRS